MDTKTVLFLFFVFRFSLIHSCAPQSLQLHQLCLHSLLCQTDRGEVVDHDSGPHRPCCTPMLPCPNKQIGQLNFIYFSEPSLLVESRPEVWDPASLRFESHFSNSIGWCRSADFIVEYWIYPEALDFFLFFGTFLLAVCHSECMTACTPPGGASPGAASLSWHF